MEVKSKLGRSGRNRQNVVESRSKFGRIRKIRPASAPTVVEVGQELAQVGVAEIGLDSAEPNPTLIKAVLSMG